MNIEEVIKNLKKIDGSRDIWRDIIKAFDGFSVNGVTEVAIESQMDDEIVHAFIDTDGSTGDPNRPGSVGRWQLRGHRCVAASLSNLYPRKVRVGNPIDSIKR
ncbi:MAG: hypothetical protein CVU99_04410 [Firmicutes bacterium HGW-Firmicutes-4]|jgi:hypothetical protein|nr:MAG: hypothetical protein CVU99_04410 [Firmicutes bacterium HGW-Firmicutes-4]